MPIIYRYDNDNSMFREYDFGFDVKAQIECGFQSILLYNFPLDHQDEGYFNSSSLTYLKREYVKRFGSNHNHKTFTLRCGFDNANSGDRKVIAMEQIAVSDYGFPRTIQRINTSDGNKVDFNASVDGKFNRRMK